MVAKITTLEPYILKFKVEKAATKIFYTLGYSNRYVILSQVEDPKDQLFKCGWFAHLDYETHLINLSKEVFSTFLASVMTFGESIPLYPP